MPLVLTTWVLLPTILAGIQPLPAAAPHGWTAPVVTEVNIFSTDGNDPREAQAHFGSDRSFAPIGRISTNQRVPDPNGENAASGQQLAPMVYSDGTAFLVSPCYALTNYHVVFGGSRTPGPDKTATVYTFDGDGASMVATPATPAIWGAMDRVWRPRNDWVLLRLENCVGSHIGWMELGGNAEEGLSPLSVMSVGFAADKDPNTLWTDQCQLRDASAGSFLDDCASSRALQVRRSWSSSQDGCWLLP